MKINRKIAIYVVSLVMALTCFAPASSICYAVGETGQTGTEQTTEPTTEPTIEPTTSAPVVDKYTGWKTEKGKKRYYKKGKLYTGWVKTKGKRYYCKKGLPLKGVKKVKKVYYRFSEKTGALQMKIGDRMDLKAQDYNSDRKYLVMVSKKKHRVRVYKGKRNKWKRIKNFKCTVGKQSTPTPSGTYRITSRGKYFNTGSNARCWYWTGFIGSIYLFHSVIYNRNSSPTHVLDGRLGGNHSHGCIRLKLKNARWFYRNVPGGSKVVIY